jgi:hypothetical protein
VRLAGAYSYGERRFKLRAEINHDPRWLGYVRLSWRRPGYWYHFQGRRERGTLTLGPYRADWRLK